MRHSCEENLATAHSAFERNRTLLTLEKILTVTAIKKGDDSENPTVKTIVLMGGEMSDIGFNHSKESAIALDDVVRTRLDLAPLLDLIDAPIKVSLQAVEVEKESEGEEWTSTLWGVWHADKHVVSKLYLVGLERHEYVEYDDDMSYEGMDAFAASRLPVEDQVRKIRFTTLAEKRHASIAYFSSSVPSGYSGPSMGGSSEFIYPRYSLVLGVTAEEYEELVTYLQRPIAFHITVTQMVIKPKS